MVRSCLLITLIKSLIQMSLWSHCSVVKTLIVIDTGPTKGPTKGQGHLFICSGQQKRGTCGIFPPHLAIPSSCLQFPYFWIVVARPEKIRNHLPERGQSLGASFGVIGLWAETFPLGSDRGAGHLPLGLLSANRSLAPIQGTPRDGSPQPSTLL